jgi:hypothetical protein
MPTAESQRKRLFTAVVQLGMQRSYYRENEGLRANGTYLSEWAQAAKCVPFRLSKCHSS